MKNDLPQKCPAEKGVLNSDRGHDGIEWLWNGVEVTSQVALSGRGADVGVIGLKVRLRTSGFTQVCTHVFIHLLICSFIYKYLVCSRWIKELYSKINQVNGDSNSLRGREMLRAGFRVIMGKKSS